MILLHLETLGQDCEAFCCLLLSGMKGILWGGSGQCHTSNPTADTGMRGSCKENDRTARSSMTLKFENRLTMVETRRGFLHNQQFYKNRSSKLLQLSNFSANQNLELKSIATVLTLTATVLTLTGKSSA